MYNLFLSNTHVAEPPTGTTCSMKRQTASGTLENERHTASGILEDERDTASGILEDEAYCFWYPRAGVPTLFRLASYF